MVVTQVRLILTLALTLTVEFQLQSLGGAKEPVKFESTCDVYAAKTGTPLFNMFTEFLNKQMNTEACQASATYVKTVPSVDPDHCYGILYRTVVYLCALLFYCLASYGSNHHGFLAASTDSENLRRSLLSAFASKKMLTLSKLSTESQ